MAQDKAKTVNANLTLIADTAIPQGRFVSGSATNSEGCALTGADGVPIGISDTYSDKTVDFAISKAVTINTSGIFFVEASAAIVLGAPVKSAASGKAVTAVSTDMAYGVAIEAASADGDYIRVAFKDGFVVA